MHNFTAAAAVSVACYITESMNVFISFQYASICTFNEIIASEDGKIIMQFSNDTRSKVEDVIHESANENVMKSFIMNSH